MTRAKWSWICWPSATREPICVRRVNHLSRRSFSKGGSTINYQSTAWGVLELFGNDGSDLSSVTQGNLSSSQIAFCGANDVGSSSDAIGVPDLSGQIQRCTRKAPRHLGRCTRGRATPSGWSSRTASEPVRRISTAHSRRKHLEAKSSRGEDRKSTRLNSSHQIISYAV